MENPTPTNNVSVGSAGITNVYRKRLIPIPWKLAIHDTQTKRGVINVRKNVLSSVLSIR